ncbi:hypothetical protein V5799_031655 [Amblyomma americanum]|uniref:Uncharacterized protein n=1 Tax=Amblyomma americanum TaxID=6943 RepID=A0AAQ4DTE7_AMBAM
MRKKPFTSRSVRDRFNLLITRYAANDRRNQKKSGTEEEYSERDQLLQDILCLIDGTSYKIKRSRKDGGSASRKDLAAASQPMNNTAARKKTAAARDLYMDRYAAAYRDTPPESAGIDLDMAGKRKSDQNTDYDFMLKRMRHKMIVKERECEVELRRLAFEESKLQWEKELKIMEHEERILERRERAEEKEEERRHRAEEQRRADARDNALIQLVQSLTAKIN